MTVASFIFKKKKKKMLNFFLCVILKVLRPDVVFDQYVSVDWQGGVGTGCHTCLYDRFKYVYLLMDYPR